MISKITAIVAAALVLGSAGAASAQTRHAGWQALYANSYNQDTRNLRFGHANDLESDVYGGTR